jgi:hypothetical protein
MLLLQSGWIGTVLKEERKRLRPKMKRILQAGD